ncbi:toll/interleukin-1 receptor domain-containing protein, partial [Pseudomonas aeruginosa]
LYDALDARGFDVFIDVRSVPPAADFQSQLWHRMSDSDVVVLIDTPGFREGRWTAEELARANATNVQILHLLWPGQKEDPA